ncbi:DUF6362 family protein [Reyranella sp.]|uniref:DUF6362 family protein n=1 Tax=Reyranella sp. TaxID=1929291 RepID=UPI003C7AC4BF
MNDWTPEMVEERLIEAAAVLRRLPAQRGQGYFSTWPQMKVEFSDLVGQTPEPMRLPPPTAAAIDRMEQVLQWFAWLEPIDSKIVWERVSGKRWKEICWEVGLARAATHEHWLYALCLITWRLNGREGLTRLGRRAAIARVRVGYGSGAACQRLRS